MNISQQLPQDCISHILSYLDPQSFQRALLINKFWNRNCYKKQSMCEPVYALFIIHSFQQSIQQLTSKYRLQVCNKVHELTKLQIHVLSVERHLRNDFLEICKVDGRQDVLEEALYMLHQLDFVQIEHEKEEKVTF